MSNYSTRLLNAKAEIRGFLLFLQPWKIISSKNEKMWSIQQKMYKKSGKTGLHPHGLRPFKSDFWIFSREADPTFCEIRQNTNCFLIRPSGITSPVPPEKHHADSHGALRSTQYLIRRPISLPCTVWQTGWYPTRCATLFAARLLFNKPYDIVFTGMRAFTRRSYIFLKRPKDAKLPAENRYLQ